MIFGKKTVTLDELKESDPDAYNKLVDQARAAVVDTSNTELENAKVALDKANATIAKLAEDQEHERINTRIKEYGEKLGVSDKAKECIEKKMSFEEALVEMVDTNNTYVKKVLDSFEDTASEQAGVNPGGDDTDKSPTDFHEAMLMIKKRDNCSIKEAANKAKVEFKELLDAQYEHINNI